MNLEDDNYHSELPPSSADKWLKCHAWLRYNRDLPDSRSSAAAEEGTKAHELLSLHLNGVQDLTEHPDTEMVDYLTSIVEWVEDQPGRKYSEFRVDFGEPFGYVGLTGTADLIIIDRDQDMLTIADLKYGRGLVEVVRNPQLMIYLIGAIHKFGSMKTFRLVILQPRGTHADGPIREYILEDGELESFMKDLEHAIAQNYLRGEAQVGDHCRKFCKALAVCPAAAAHTIKLFRSTPVE